MKARRLSVAAAGLAVLAATAAENPRQTAWKLAEAAIRDSGSRPGAPDFLTWPIARDIFPCPVEPRRTGDPAAPRDLFDESFHYNREAAARLCAPLTRAQGAPPLDGALRFWTRSQPRPSTIDPPFPDGAKLAAAFWNVVRRPVDPRMGKIVELPVRSGAQTLTRRIRITIREQMNAESSSCAPPAGQGDPAAPGVKDVSIKDFFAIRLTPGERYSGASCGDFAVLVAFHLVHKVDGRWLWTTFWWDAESSEFSAGRPSSFAGAGENPRAWRNYAMDAAYDTTATIFNPWRIEERRDNCASCHSKVTSYKDEASGDQIFFDSVTAARNHFQ